MAIATKLRSVGRRRSLIELNLPAGMTDNYNSIVRHVPTARRWYNVLREADNDRENIRALPEVRGAQLGAQARMLEVQEDAYSIVRDRCPALCRRCPSPAYA